MTKSSLKELRLNAETAINDGINNKEQLCAALPTLVAFQAGIKAIEALAKETKQIAAQLSDLCSDYAADHPEYVFGNTLAVSPIGVTSGEVTVNGETYHFSDGFKGFKRIDESRNISQDFLATLPADWVKQKLELAIQKVDEASDMDITEAGLMRKPNRVWSLIG